MHKFIRKIAVTMLATSAIFGGALSWIPLSKTVLLEPLAGLEQARADMRSQTITALRNHYKSVPTMMGEFLQFGPKGEQTGGTFIIKRPGKIRFDYEEPSPMEVVSNGKAVMVVNHKMKTFNSYPLKKTPLRLLLDNGFDIKEKSILKVTSDDKVTSIVMGDKQIFGKSIITMLFDPDSFELRQWTVKDAQGKETTVMIFNVKNNVQVPNRHFQINKSKYRRN